MPDRPAGEGADLREGSLQPGIERVGTRCESPDAAEERESSSATPTAILVAHLLSSRIGRTGISVLQSAIGLFETCMNHPSRGALVLQSGR